LHQDRLFADPETGQGISGNAAMAFWDSFGRR
jgi:hypothetical protein